LRAALEESRLARFWRPRLRAPRRPALAAPLRLRQGWPPGVPTARRRAEDSVREPEHAPTTTGGSPVGRVKERLIVERPLFSASVPAGRHPQASGHHERGPFPRALRRVPLPGNRQVRKRESLCPHPRAAASHPSSSNVESGASTESLPTTASRVAPRAPRREGSRVPPAWERSPITPARGIPAGEITFTPSFQTTLGPAERAMAPDAPVDVQERP